MERLRGFGLLLGVAVLSAVLLYPVFVYDHVLPHDVELADGVLDVARLPLSDGLYELAGTVETYPDLFVGPAAADRPAPQIVALPFVWKAQTGVTHASCRFVLEGLQPGTTYGFYIGEAYSAYRVYADGHMISQLGVPSEDPHRTRPEMRLQSAVFQPSGSSCEIVIHASTHSSDPVGIWQAILFGTADRIHAHEVRVKLADAFVNGAILFMTLYVWILHLIMRSDRAVLYFALSCTFVTTKNLLSNQHLVLGTLSLLPYEAGLRLAYLMVPAMVLSFVLFAREHFKIESWKTVQRVLQALSLIEAVLILVLPQQWYQQTFVVYQAIAMAAALMVVGWAVHSLVRQMEGAGLYLAGFVLFALSAVNDVLYSMQVIRTGYFIGFGLFALILSQAAILAMRMRRALLTEAFLKEHLEQQVRERTLELEREKERFENLSKVDSLTGLYNKGALLEMIRHEVEAFDHYEHPFSIVMVDLDDFKAINDTHGHVCGDGVLRQVAGLLLAQSRRADFIGRYGGEEFLMVLPFTVGEDAMRHAEQLRGQIADATFESDGHAIRLTASFGIATARTVPVETVQLIRKADEAMYEAKHQGKNRVVARDL